MTGHVFVDESKQRDYLLVAAVLAPGDLAFARRTLRRLVMPGQRRLHMKKERNVRRNAIVEAIAEIGVVATIYKVAQPGRRELLARESCLRAMVTDVAAAGHELLILEQDDSLLRWDRQRLVEITHDAECRGALRYEHRRAEHELLLAVPDAIAWCWARDRLWRSRIQPFVTQIRVIAI